MKNKFVQALVVLVALIAVGELLLIPQQRITERLREEQFIQKRLSQEKQLKLGQTGAAVALGGLRSLIAAVMNLQAYGYFEEQEWVELEQLFEVIVTLQPQNTYYWETGSWHLAYNAYYDFETKIGLSPARCRLKQREYQEKGENLLLRGVDENPDSIQLWKSLGRLYTDPHRTYDFERAIGYFDHALASPNVTDRMRREYFYTLGRVKGQEAEALALGDELGARGNFRYSSMRSLYCALALIVDPTQAQDPSALITKVFDGNEALAYKDLTNYWLRTERELFPRGNVGVVITLLAEKLKVPDAYNPLITPTMDRLR